MDLGTCALLLYAPNASFVVVKGVSAQWAARDNPFPFGDLEAVAHTGHCLNAHIFHDPRSFPPPLFICSTEMC